MGHTSLYIARQTLVLYDYLYDYSAPSASSQHLSYPSGLKALIKTRSGPSSLFYALAFPIPRRPFQQISLQQAKALGSDLANYVFVLSATNPGSCFAIASSKLDVGRGKMCENEVRVATFNLTLLTRTCGAEQYSERSTAPRIAEECLNFYMKKEH